MSRHHPKKSSFKAKKNTDDYRSILVKASLAQSEGRLAEAEKGYLKVLKKKPGWGQVLNALGTVYLDRSQTDKAKKCFARAANLKQPNLSACYNLARLMQREGDHEGALPIYRKILDEQPEFGEAWNNAGIACRETGDPDTAISCFQNAATFAPHMAEAWNNLGVAQDESALFEDSAKSYRRAIELSPDYASAHFNLGSTLQKLKRFGEAEEQYKKVLEFKPDDEAALFMLQSLGAIPSIPEAAPVEHVRRIFDQCAGTFEKVLVQELEYKTPELLFNLAYPHLTTASTVLDLGCGTGLGAQLYRPFAQSMTGVDISPKMLEKAAEKNIYDTLEVLDIFQQWSFPRKFDLICCADVFVYFGNLQRIIGSISANLLSGGITCFSVERLENDDMDYLLHSSGRYAHSRNYIQDCLSRHGFQVLEEAEADLRKQSGNTVSGLLTVARKVP